MSKPLSTTVTLPHWRPALVLLARLSVAAVFLFAAWPKLRDPHEFARAIDNYHLLPLRLVPYLALSVPVLELVIALALITGIAERGAALMAAGLLCVFALAIAQALWRGIDIDCGCFGQALESRAGWSSVWRNVALTALAALVVLHPSVPWRWQRSHVP